MVYKISKGCSSILKILMEVNSGVQDCHTHSSPRNSHGIYVFTINVSLLPDSHHDFLLFLLGYSIMKESVPRHRVPWSGEDCQAVKTA